MKTKTLRFLFFSVFLIIASGAKMQAQTTGIESGAIYKLRSSASSKLLNSSNSRLTNSNNVDIWTDTDSDAERWLVAYIGNNLYTLVNIGTGKYLHLANATPANLVNVDQYDNSNDNQVRWFVVNNGDGTFTLRPGANSAFSLDVNGALTADGTNVQLWTNNNNSNQKWTFEKVTARSAAPTAAIADQAFAAWKSKYYYSSNGGGHMDGGFWGEAEIIEIVIDAYETTGKSIYKDMIQDMYNGFVGNNGTDWTYNSYNDDIMWMTIACVRAYLCTGNQTYLDRATYHFTQVYNRAWNTNYGGGLLWYVGRTTKNSCINGPAIVAACYLADATGDNAYLTKAEAIYAWQRSMLYNASTGAVYDSYDGPGNINIWSSTYNQGSFLGAAVMLYKRTGNQTYYDDAVKIANYTRNNMFADDVMNGEESGGDLPGFKGIFMRYARRYITDLNKSDYIPWLKKNAKVAFNNRNSQGIAYTQFNTRTPEVNSYPPFNTSSSVSALINCPLVDNVVKTAFTSIQAEDFDYIRGPIVDPSSDGTDKLGWIQNGNYTAYNNVDFGTAGVATAEFRFSNGTTVTNKIEIRWGSPTGILMGTATLAPTGGWSNYVTVSCGVTNATGLKNIYLVYKGTGYLADINYFKFTQGQSPVTFFKDCGYGGTQVGVGPGDYTLADLQAIGILNDDISSLKVITGYTVYAYADDNFAGASITLNANNDCLVDEGWNDRITSLKITASAPLKAPKAITDNQDSANTGHLTVYPNPVNDLLYITGIKGSSIIEIYSLTGRKVIESTINRIDVSQLDSGIYIIKVNFENGVTKLKFIKK